MSWATRRRFIIVAILVVIIGGIVGATTFLSVHQAPSCTDGRQNQNEEGVDCGGPCPYLCTISQTAPSVRFARALSPIPGRTDVIAYVDNPNPGSATHQAHFSVELYDDRNSVIAKGSGAVDLPAGATVPVFIPNFFSGTQNAARAFITFDATSFAWFKAERVTSPVVVRDVIPTQTGTPRITATLVNQTANLLRNVQVVVTVFNANGNAIAASQTVASLIPGQGTAEVVFTWPSAFSEPVSRIEVIPLATLLP